MIYDNMIQPEPFPRNFLFVWYNRNINWLEYIINPIFINNCFCFQFHIKNAAFFDSSSLSIFLNSKNNIVTNLKLLISDNKSISFFTCRFSIMKLQLRIKRIQNLNIISFCIAFISIWSLGCFYIFFNPKFLPPFFCFTI